MKLLKVSRVLKKEQNNSILFYVYFYDELRVLIITEYHIFLAKRGNLQLRLSPEEFIKDDLVYVDVFAFIANKSFVNRHKGNIKYYGWNTLGENNG